MVEEVKNKRTTKINENEESYCENQLIFPQFNLTLNRFSRRSEKVRRINSEIILMGYSIKKV